MEQIEHDTTFMTPGNGIRRVNNLPLFLGGGATLIFLVVMALVTWDRAEQQHRPEDSVERQIQPLDTLPLRVPVTEKKPRHTNTFAQDIVDRLGGFCAGYEAICSNTITVKPAEALQKLEAAMPKVTSLKYRVKVSVVPVDDE